MTRMTLVERRQKLIEAALAVIAREGVPAATTRAIASEAGMPLASFHYAFESHQALLNEAMEVLDQAEQACWESIELAGESMSEVVTGLLNTYLDDVVERSSSYLSLLELTDHALRTEGQRERPVRWRLKRVESLVEKLEAFCDAHPGLPHPDCKAFAESLLVVTDGLVMRYLVTGDAAGTRRAVDGWVQMMDVQRAL